MNTVRLGEKFEHLQEILNRLDNVAVAFSGGIDSTFLLYAACEALGKNKVTAFHGVSCLLPAHSVQTTLQIFKRYFSGKAELRKIHIHPLQWREFVLNDNDRCYFCKKRIYSIFKKEMEKKGGRYLVDGTNADDLKELRPGLRAIEELGVQMPLVMAGFHKFEIRDQAKIIGFENHDLPSNSCLATRVSTHTPLNAEIIKLIDDAERFLHEKGFNGCRVRPREEWTVIEVGSDNFEGITLRENRESILDYFQSIGLSRVLLDLHGRE